MLLRKWQRAVAENEETGGIFCLVPLKEPCVREGIEFPVLRIAQIRQSKPITKNAISRNSRETPPEIVMTGRWPAKEKPRTDAQDPKNHRSNSEAAELKRRRAS